MVVADLKYVEFSLLKQYNQVKPLVLLFHDDLTHELYWST